MKSYVQKITISLVREHTDDISKKMTTPEEIASLSLIDKELINCDREKFIVLHLSTKNQLISYEIVSIGNLNATIIHPREVFKSAILSNASSIIICHNHPSGIPEPSNDDMVITIRLKDAGELLGIELLDHIIFGYKSFYSFKEKDLL